jgi:4-hydroxythreonine-4-phosphate dehydrogenase
LIKRLAYTVGEPAGIGPDLAILLASDLLASNKQSANTVTHSDYEFAVISDPELILERAEQLKKKIKLREIHPADKAKVSQPGELAIIPSALTQTAQAGTLNPQNGQAILNTLDTAIDLCQQQLAHAMVTGPIQKSVINDAGISFSGHTEYLAEKTNTPQVVMLLATEGLRVALATTHLPLKDVANAIQKESLQKTLRILHSDLQQKFSLKNPKILVCGLNPHAGENGHLGKEEMTTIIPALEELRAENIDCIGPLPADTLFTPKHLEKADAVLAMYHDQGLPVLKHKGFGAAANITLGLPIIRTSVDHGTALDLAGTGNIDTGSLQTAINYALTMDMVKP